jgi:hypothetical protein
MSEPIMGRNLLIGGGAAACAACCAAPVLAVIGVTVAGTAATVAHDHVRAAGRLGP